MLAAAIITFREILEICLIISIISAALNSIKNKNIILLFGMIVGIIFSILIAFSFNHLNSLFSDIGQEILNISILSISIICIGYTCILINKHSKDIHSRIDIAKQQFENNEINYFALIMVISLVISREGAELIIFLHGVYASGQSIENITLGILLGSLAGIVISFLFYSGLLKIPFKYFFKTINILLILLAAGMSSQLANLLHASNLVSIFYQQVWDSSWLVSDSSMIGKIFYNLIGYSARPTELQLLCYLATIMTMYCLIFYKKEQPRQ